MKIVYCIVVLIVMVSCGQLKRVAASWTDYSEICVDGVTYLQFTSGASVKYNQNGSLAKCE